MWLNSGRAMQPDRLGEDLGKPFHRLLLVQFKDTIERTRTIPLLGTGLGATLQLFGTPNMLDLGSVPLGKSTSATLQPAFCPSMAHASPVGPAPMTSTS